MKKKIIHVMYRIKYGAFIDVQLNGYIYSKIFS